MNVHIRLPHLPASGFLRFGYSKGVTGCPTHATGGILGHLGHDSLMGVRNGKPNELLGQS